MSKNEVLVQYLIEKGVKLSGEMAWPPDAAIEVIDYMANAGEAVVGVEWWRDVRGMATWEATSNYHCDHSLPHSEYVAACAKGAKDFIEQFRNEPGALFNI